METAMETNHLIPQSTYTAKTDILNHTCLHPADRLVLRPPTADIGRLAILRDGSVERRFTVLRRMELFSALPENRLRVLAESMSERAYPAGSAVIHAEDEAGAYLYIVADGEVAVTVESSESKETVLATLQAGEYFGEMALLDDAPRAATARAVKAARMLLLRREDFLRHLKQSPELALALLTEVNKRLRQSNRKVAGLCYRSMHARVAAALMGLMEDKGVRLREDGFSRVMIKNRPTQKFMAEMAGTSRESVSRTLAAWGREGLLRKRGRDLCILEEDRIRGLAVA